MDSTDTQVLDLIIAWRNAGQRAALITVVRTWGSSPRPAGAWAAIREDGVLAGSVSGGCVEEDLIARVRDGEFAGGLPQVVRYGVTRDEAARFGLPCGGTLELVVEPAPDPGDLAVLRERIAAGRMTARTLHMASGKVMLENAASSETLAWDGNLLTTLHGPALRLLVIGAGQIARYLADMAAPLGYAVTVCDPREETRAAWPADSRATLLTDMPDDVVRAMSPDSRTAVVALTHDPKLDDLALLEALQSPAFYVGALGSRANATKRRERLREFFNFSDAQLNRLRGPVGLTIGSRTPPEIAVAILAEMIKVRNLGEA